MVAETELNRCVSAIRGLFAAAACSCALVDDEGGMLTYAAADGEGAAEIVGVELPVGRGLAGWAVMSGQSLAVRDVRADPRFARDVAETTRYVPTSMLVSPMFGPDGDVTGVVSVLDPGVDQGADWTLAVLGTLASHLATILELAPSGAQQGRGESRWERLGREVLAAVDEFRR